jgi:hypothetical protein
MTTIIRKIALTSVLAFVANTNLFAHEFAPTDGSGSVEVMPDPLPWVIGPVDLHALQAATAYTIDGSDPLVASLFEKLGIRDGRSKLPLAQAKGVPWEFVFFPESPQCPGSNLLVRGSFKFHDKSTWWPTAINVPGSSWGCSTAPKYTLICTVEDQYVVMASTRLWQQRYTFVVGDLPRTTVKVREGQYSDVLYLYASGGGCPV